MSNRTRKTTTMATYQERQTVPVLPTACFIRHGYDIEEGPHSPSDVALLEREGKEDTGLPLRRVRSRVRRLWQDGKISGPRWLRSSGGLATTALASTAPATPCAVEACAGGCP